MHKFIRVLAPGLVLAVLALPLAAFAWGRAGVGVHVGGGYYRGGGYYGPHYYHGWYGPRYGYWYGPGYYPYYWYGPGWGYYYYPPPAEVYEPPAEVVDQPPPAYWYYCASAKTYFPYVNACPEGWQAVPAQTAAPPQQQPQAEAQPAAPVPAPNGKVVYRLGDLLFATDQADLGPGATATLDTMLAALAKEPNRRIVVEGHTDNSGDGAYNRELSQRRAEAVKQYLVAHGIAADRISAVGKGEADPIASNDTAEGRKRNRRVDVIVS